MSYHLLLYHEDLKITCSDIQEWKNKYSDSINPPLSPNYELIKNAGYFPVAFIQDVEDVDKILEKFECKKRYSLMVADGENSGKVLYAKEITNVRKKPDISGE